MARTIVSAHNIFTLCLKTFLYFLLFLVIGLFVMPQRSQAATANWDQADTTHIQGYRLYAAEGSCSNPSYFNFVQAYGVVTTGLVPTPAGGGTYCYFLTAYNSIGESIPSNRAEFSFPITPQCPPISYCKTLKGQARKQCLACQ